MYIENAPKPISIKLSPGEHVTVTSAIMVMNRIIKCTSKMSVNVLVYSDFFVIVETTTEGTIREVYSDNWDFHIKGK